MTNNRKNNEYWSFSFQSILVQPKKTAINMGIVMNLEPANVIPIGIALQIALVNKKYLFYYGWPYITVILFSEFICKSNVDCNENGICTDQKCQCIPGWDSQKDCMSK
jgi:hypothetical protein